MAVGTDKIAGRMAGRTAGSPSWRGPGVAGPAGLALAALLLCLALAAIVALAIASEGPGRGGGAHAHVRHVAAFTAMQAALSAVLALGLAAPVARSCWRRASGWRTRHLIAFTFLPVVMPTTVAASGIIGVWGQNGLVSTLLRAAGFDGLAPVYGLGAVLLAHVFFNAPLMVRVLAGAYAGIPGAQWRVASQLGLGPLARFRLIEWPAIARVIPGLLAIVFLVCFTSFSLILILGGGPRVTTLEVSIYTALRFDFNLALAGRLALLQLVICAGVVVALSFFTGRSWAARPDPGRPPAPQRGDDTPLARCLDALVLSVFGVVAMLPVLLVVIEGIGGKLVEVLGWPAFHRAAATSLSIALVSGLLATVMALVMAISRTRLAAAGRATWALDMSVSLYLSISAIVLGTGLFILLRGVADIFAIAPALVVLGNILVALPFIYRVIEGRLATLGAAQDRLCAGLGIRGWRRLRHVTLPAMAPELGYAAGIGCALSLGDMTIIALFGSQDFQTLPWLLYQTMARYRAGEAAALAFLLLCMTLLLFALFVMAARLLGPRGAAGPPAPRGVAGPSARRGVAGPSARRGVAGPSARRGVAGPSARRGVAGPSARRDVAGPPSPRGVAGPPSPRGMAGSPAPSTSDGDRGRA